MRKRRRGHYQCSYQSRGGSVALFKFLPLLDAGRERGNFKALRSRHPRVLFFGCLARKIKDYIARSFRRNRVMQHNSGEPRGSATPTGRAKKSAHPTKRTMSPGRIYIGCTTCIRRRCPDDIFKSLGARAISICVQVMFLTPGIIAQKLRYH